jgi:predicted transcriptional regulator
MPTERLSMRRIRQLLALHFSAGASRRAIGRELGIAPSTVREYLARAAAAGIGWPLGADVTDESLMARLFVNAGVRAGARELPGIIAQHHGIAQEVVRVDAAPDRSLGGDLQDRASWSVRWMMDCHGIVSPDVV